MLELRVVKGDSLRGQKFALPQSGSVIVGRDSSCDVAIPSKGISKRHCRLTVLSGHRLEVEDLGSSNGTFVNGVLVKKHLLRVGDLLNLHDISLQVAVRAPELVVDNGVPSNFGSIPSAATDAVTSPSSQEGGLGRWLGKNVYPLADGLAEKFDLRFLLLSFFLIWSTLIIALTAAPFREKANERVIQQASEVAKLYARQLVRVNQQAIVDQRYRDLVADLDARPGQTPGVLNALVLDSTSAQILAPADFFGQGLPSTFASNAANQDKEFVQVDSDGTIYASAPLKIGSAQGNKTVATAFVVFNPSARSFSVASLFEQIVDSLLKALVVSILLLLFVYRWLEGSLIQLTQKIDMAMKSADSNISSTVRWPILQTLTEQISAALGRASGQGESTLTGEAWALAAVNNSMSAAAAFDNDLRVLAWNSAMENVVGIRASIAVGSDISGASRDVAFESLVKELAQTASVVPWGTQQRTIEFSGRRYAASLVYGQGAFLLNLGLLEEGV